MTYSIIGILAVIILLISNRDILWNRSEKKADCRSAESSLFSVWGSGLLYY